MTVLVENKCILQYARSLVSCKLWHHVEVRLHHQSFGVLCQLPLVDRLWAVDEQPTTNLTRGFSFCFVFFTRTLLILLQFSIFAFCLGFSPGLSHPNRVSFCLFWFLTPDTLGTSKRGLEYFFGVRSPSDGKPLFFRRAGGGSENPGWNYTDLQQKNKREL